MSRPPTSRLHEAHVNLGFPRGATLPDPGRVLEGEGKAMRHIKFRSPDELERPFVRRYIRTAIEQVGAAAERGTGKTVIKPIGAKRAAAKKPVKRQRTKS